MPTHGCAWCGAEAPYEQDVLHYEGCPEAWVNNVTILIDRQAEYWTKLTIREKRFVLSLMKDGWKVVPPKLENSNTNG